MIAAVEWIPKGVANPNPSKYEWSRAEQMFLERAKNGAMKEAEREGAQDEEEWEDTGDVEVDDADAEVMASSANVTKKVVVPKVDLSSLPADLRMDEYGDDDDEDDGGNDGEIGHLIVGQVSIVLFLSGFHCNTVIILLLYVYLV